MYIHNYWIRSKLLTRFHWALILQIETLFTVTSGTGFATHYYLRAVFPGPVTSVSHSVGERNVIVTVNKPHPEQWQGFSTHSADGSLNQV